MNITRLSALNKKVKKQAGGNVINVTMPKGNKVLLDRSSKEYADLYNNGKLMNKVGDDSYVAPSIKATEIVTTAPAWLKAKRLAEKRYTKEQFSKEALPTWAGALGENSNNLSENSLKEYNKRINSNVTNSLIDNLNFNFSKAEQELVKNSGDNNLINSYKYFRDKQIPTSFVEKHLNSFNNNIRETVVDQMPDILDNNRQIPGVNTILKLPHLNKLKVAKTAFYDGRPLSGLAELIKIPKVSNFVGDLAVNTLASNPSDYSIENLENNYMSPLRLYAGKNNFIASKINKEIKNSGRINSNSDLPKYNLPEITEAGELMNKKYGTSTNDFVEFVENYMVGRNKTYRETLTAFEKYQQQKQSTKKKSDNRSQILTPSIVVKK